MENSAACVCVEKEDSDGGEWYKDTTRDKASNVVAWI